MKIQLKLFTILFLFSLILVIALVAVMQWSIDKGMVDYVNTREMNVVKPMAPTLVAIYQKNKSWDGIRQDNRWFRKLIREQQFLAGIHDQSSSRRPPKPRDVKRSFENKQQNSNHHVRNRRDKEHKPPRYRDDSNRTPPREEKRRPPPPKAFQVSYAVLDVNKELVVGDFPEDKEYSYSALMYYDEVVGYLAVSKRNQLTNGYELDFIEQQKHYLWLVAMAIMGLVVLVSFPLSRHLVSPIKQLAEGMHNLTRGKYGKLVLMKRKDEFSDLSRDYNELATTLLQNEEARKRWLANISHELRTPVAILRGELEAILDGVRALNLEQIDSAHQEVLHLQRLIDDLHALTSADIGGMSYKKEQFNFIPYIKELSEKFSVYLAENHLTFKLACELEESMIFADKTRLCQLFENIINNCIKYATGGTKVNLSVTQVKNKLQIVIEDDGCGVEPQHFEHLFEHLYRVEDSRNRNTGGSGLGLSICAHIVTAHEGSIVAKQSSLDGLAVVIELPLM